MTHRWRLWIVLASAVALGSGLSRPACAQAKKKRYNILFLFADDQRADTIAALGNEHISTPNIDSLVRRGTTFTRAYIMGSMSGAVCMPSRAMLLTGRNLFRTHMRMQGMPTLGEILQRAGYETFGVGKWHNGAESFVRTFAAGDAVMLGGMSDHFNVPVNHRRPDGKMVRYSAKGIHSSELFADAAIKFLKSRAKINNRDRPFFLYVAFTAPHDPRDPPRKYREMYYRKRPPLPKNFLPLHPFNLCSDMFGRDEVLAPFPRTEAVIRDQLAEYYGLITHLDEQIGRILQTLREIGELENTIIVYSADNGLALGSHGLLGKQSVYDHSVHVPLIFAGPGIPRNQKRDALVYLFDIFPTLCAINNVPPPAGLDGTSLMDVIQGRSRSVRESLYFNYKYNQRGVRDDRWKLIVYPKINHQVLFDLKKDPLEMHNLAAEGKHSNTVARLRDLLLDWEKEAGARPMPLTVENPLPRTVELVGRVRRPDRWQPEWIRKKYFGK